MILKKTIYTLIITLSFLLLSSCLSISKIREPKKISNLIMDKGQLNANQLTSYFLSRNTKAKKRYIKKIAQYYIDEACAEGVNSDVAFAQMCLETGYLRFGGLVKPEFHNYCGLGAMDSEHPGEIFETEQVGIRAHIQHLQAYGTTEEVSLVKELVDPRYNWVHKTKYVENIYGLAGTWASDPMYGQKLERILINMANFL